MLLLEQTRLKLIKLEFVEAALARRVPELVLIETKGVVSACASFDLSLHVEHFKQTVASLEKDISWGEFEE